MRPLTAQDGILSRYVPEILALLQSCEQRGGRRDAILRPSKGPASQRILRVRSVLLGKMSVSCVLATDWGSFLRITQMSPWFGHDTRYECDR